MGSGGSTVDAMVIGCLGVDRRAAARRRKSIFSGFLGLGLMTNVRFWCHFCILYSVIFSIKNRTMRTIFPPKKILYKTNIHPSAPHARKGISGCPRVLLSSASVCVYYCRTYYKAVRGGGRRRVDDMCYDRRRAEACVDESARHVLVVSVFCIL